MVSPDKYIRKAYLNALSSITSGSINIPVFDRRMPINIKPIPQTRIIISSQTKRSSSESKCGHGWECSMLLDIISEQNVSFVNMAVVDDIEEQINDQIDLWQASHREFYIPPFVCYYTRFSDSHDIELETPTTTIIRKLVRYTHRLNSLTTIEGGFPYRLPFLLS